MEKMNQAFEKMKILVGMDVEDEEQLQQDPSFIYDSIATALYLPNRLYGFAICLAAGINCTILSMLVLFKLMKFGITSSFGDLLALGSTAFLVGPKRQVTMMLDPVHIYATAIYIASIIIALFCAVYVWNKLLTFLGIVWSSYLVQLKLQSVCEVLVSKFIANALTQNFSVRYNCRML